MSTFIDDYNNCYKSPYIPQKVIGFSGIDPSSVCDFNGEGGNGGLSEDEINQLIALYVSNLKIRIDSGNVDLDADEPEPPYVTLRPDEIPHEKLDELLGGSDDGHYHLTEDELLKLETLLDELMPDGELILPESGESNHELLISLMGGKSNEHYHFTNDQWRKLLKLLEVLFPNGEDEPVFPNVPISPDNPDNQDNPSGGDDEDMFGGLPQATPPAWTRQNFPTNYTAYGGVHRMYYGTIPKTLNPATIALLVPMRHTDTSTTYQKNKYWLYTQDLVTWTSWFKHSIETYGKNVQYLYRGIYSTSGSLSRCILYLLGYQSTEKRVQYYGKNSSTYGVYSSAGSDYSGATSWLAGCYSPQNGGIYLFASQDGHICRMLGTNTNTEKENITCGLSGVNPGCATWIPTAQYFCVAGPDGTAISATGTSWETHTDAPHNLQDMTWREDLETPCLFAWREEDRKFYASSDGKMWKKVGNLPTMGQLSTIAALDYNSDLKWYCAVGGTGKTAYFSKDLNHWIGTTITNSGTIEAGSVIWMPSVQKYVLMPTSGSSYYTFTPADWSDE